MALNRCIMISGASSGLGAALALKYADADTTLFLTGRNEERLKSAADACAQKGAKVYIQILDVTDAGAVSAWVADVSAEMPIDLVIANAGVLQTHDKDRVLESADKAWQQVSTNVGGVINFLTAVAPYMQTRKKGHVALISSLSALQPLADLPAYSGSKAAVVAYGEAMRAYLHEDNVLVSVICPGYIKTPMTDVRENWRPFQMSADEAATLIKRALDDKKGFYAFPWPMVIATRLGRLLPWKLRRHVTAAFNYRR